MFEHHVKASEMDESEEVFDMVFPSGNESTEVLSMRRAVPFPIVCDIAGARVHPEPCVSGRAGCAGFEIVGGISIGNAL
jgi:hypothetical protein